MCLIDDNQASNIASEVVKIGHGMGGMVVIGEKLTVTKSIE